MPGHEEEESNEVEGVAEGDAPAVESDEAAEEPDNEEGSEEKTGDASD